MDGADETLRRAAQEYLARDEDDLYALLLPQHVRDQMYSRGGLLARGRTLFATTFGEVRPAICRAYTAQKEATRDAIDLVVLVATTLATLPLGGVPVLPMAALVVKIGLNELCRGAEDT